MRHSATFLVALLLPTAVLLQDLSEIDRNWVAKLLGNVGTETQKKDDKLEANKGVVTLPPETLAWLGNFLPDNTTTSTTTTSTTTTSTTTTSTTTTSTTTTTPTSDASNRFDPDLTPDVTVTEYGPCETDEGLPGICVSQDQCDNKGVVDNTTLIDLRAGKCPHYLQRCCLRSDFTRTTPKPPVINNKCGWSNPDASILRINDRENINRKTYADFGEYPWMIAVVMKSLGEQEWSPKKYLGGGTLIHPSVVITAAHKVDRYNADQIKCRAGEWDTRTTLESYPHQERDVKKIIIHEEVYITPAYNDISMLVLNKPFELQNAPNIGIACLSAELPPPGTKCYSTGWGKELGTTTNALILKKVELPYVPMDTCQTELRKTRLSARFNLHSSHICAGGEAGADTCKGDGGSSLACPIEEGPEAQRFAVYGMVAFGVGCGDPIPAVYVNIPHLHSWVDSKMIAEGFDTSIYRP